MRPVPLGLPDHPLPSPATSLSPQVVLFYLWAEFHLSLTMPFASYLSLIKKSFSSPFGNIRPPGRWMLSGRVGVRQRAAGSHHERFPSPSPAS